MINCWPIGHITFPFLTPNYTIWHLFGDISFAFGPITCKLQPKQVNNPHPKKIKWLHNILHLVFHILFWVTLQG